MDITPWIADYLRFCQEHKRLAKNSCRQIELFVRRFDQFLHSEGLTSWNRLDISHIDRFVRRQASRNNIGRIQLVQAFPELEGLEPATDQSKLEEILGKIGQGVDDFFRSIPNTASLEMAHQEWLKKDGKATAFWFTFGPILSSPMSLQASAWYSGYGFAALSIFAAVVLYAFRTSLGGRPLIAGSRLDE